MDVADIIVLVTVKAIVIIVAALVGTEFLIRPSKEPGSAVKTYSFHSSNVFIKIEKIYLRCITKISYRSDYYLINRLQTDINDF